MSARKIRQNGCGIKIGQITATILLPEGEQDPEVKLQQRTMREPGLTAFLRNRVIMNKSEPVIIARAHTEGEASVIKSLLGSYNIPCHFSSELLGRFYPDPDESLGKIRLYVPASLEEDARHILEEHKRHEASLRLVED